MMDSVTTAESDWLRKVEALDWPEHECYLQKTRFRPMYDRAFAELLGRLASEEYYRRPSLRDDFVQRFDQWIHDSQLNSIAGLGEFPHRDVTIGVTHSLDDLHIVYGQRLVVFAKEYPYHRRIRPDIQHRNLETLRDGDVLVFSIPSVCHGDLHPQTSAILERCEALRIPVHADAAWYGCLRDFHFDFSHPAIQTVSFSLSKGLGLGSHRIGVRYSRERQAGPITVINDFHMNIDSLMWYGLSFMNEFGSDYIQNRYANAYRVVCEKLKLKPTKTIHLAIQTSLDDHGHPQVLPVGIRPFLRFLVDQVDEFK